MNVRSLGFYFKDVLTGGYVKTKFEQLENSECFLESELDHMLKYVTGNIKFYKNKQLGLQTKSQKLQDFPIVDKNIINSESYNFENDQIHIYHTMRTSGTTGEPLVSNQDEKKRKATVASLIYYNEMSGISLGEKFLYVKSFSQKKQSFSEKLKLFAKNEVRLDVDEINDETMKNFISYLDIGKIKSVIGYAAFYEYLTYYIVKNNITRDYKNVNFITTSSVLPKESKDELRSRLSVSIHDRYANQEIGILAHTLGTDHFFVSPQIVMEVVNPKNGKPVKPGEMGNIIVTDLYNRRMPFIRYNTGDYGVVKKYNDLGFVSELYEISGRKVTMISVGNGYVTSHAISVYMRDLGIQKWQIIVFSKKNIQLNLITESIQKAKLAQKRLEGLLSGYKVKLILNNPKKFVKNKSGKEELIIHQ